MANIFENLWNKEQNAIPSIGAVAQNDISFGLDDITKNFKTDLGLSSLLNMYSIPKTMVDAQFGVSSSYASPQMEEELRRQIMSDIRRTGRTSGGITYEDLGFDTMYNATGEHIEISKNPGFRNPLGINTAQQSIGLTGGKMDYSLDPTTGKVAFTGGTDYSFGSGFGNQFGDAEWNSNISVDPALIQKEINAFSPQETYRQGQIQIRKPKVVYPTFGSRTLDNSSSVLLDSCSSLVDKFSRISGFGRQQVTRRRVNQSDSKSAK